MTWLMRFIRKSRAHQQLDSELRFHLEQQIADYIASGMPPDEAHRRARLEFGGLDAAHRATSSKCCFKMSFACCANLPASRS